MHRGVLALSCDGLKRSFSIRTCGEPTPVFGVGDERSRTFRIEDLAGARLTQGLKEANLMSGACKAILWPRLVCSWDQYQSRLERIRVMACSQLGTQESLQRSTDLDMALTIVWPDTLSSREGD